MWSFVQVKISNLHAFLFLSKKQRFERSHTASDMQWNVFARQWGRQFAEAKNIIRYLNSYSENLEKSGIKNVPVAEKLKIYHKDWLYLLTKFEHPDEKGFFKPWWISIDSTYDYFLDISVPGYPVFLSKFDVFTNGWVKTEYFSSVSELLLLLEDKHKLGIHIENIKKKTIPYYDDILKWFP